jgi:hypothetical protein
MFNNNKLSIHVYDDVIVIKNKNGMEKQFPRCGMTKVEFFVLDMAKKGKLDDLLV